MKFIYFPILSFNHEFWIEDKYFNGFEFHKNWLVNALYLRGYEHNWKVKNNLKLMVDSGGFQVQFKDKKIDKFMIFDTQKKLGDWYFILDQPSYLGDWMEGVRATNKNIEEALDFGLEKNKLILILHGEGFEKTKSWWDVIGSWDIDKVAIANKLSGSIRVSVGLNYAIFLIWLLENDDRKFDIIHLLGFSAIKSLPLFFYILKDYEDRVNYLTFDSKQSTALAYTMSYLYKNKRLDLRGGRERDGLVQFDLNKNLPCDCEACRFANELGWQKIRDNYTTQFYSLLTIHNILQLNSYCEQLMKMSKEELRILMKNEVGVKDKTIMSFLDKYDNFISNGRKESFFESCKKLVGMEDEKRRLVL